MSEIAPSDARDLFPPLGAVHRALYSPTSARVDGVDVRWRGYTGEFPEFSIVD